MKWIYWLLSLMAWLLLFVRVADAARSDTHPLKKPSRQGVVQDDKGRFAGIVDADGRITDPQGYYKGRSRNGVIYDEKGYFKGRVHSR